MSLPLYCPCRVAQPDFAPRALHAGGVFGAHKTFREVLETFHIVEDMDPKDIVIKDTGPAAAPACTATLPTSAPAAAASAVAASPPAAAAAVAAQPAVAAAADLQAASASSSWCVGLRTGAW